MTWPSKPGALLFSCNAETPRERAAGTGVGFRTRLNLEKGSQHASFVLPQHGALTTHE